MTSYVKLFENEAGSFGLRLSFETLSFDYSANTRSCRLKLLAKNEMDADVTVSGVGALGVLSVFGMEFVLPKDFTVNCGVETAIFDSSSITINNNLYVSSAKFALELRYDSDDLGLTPAEISGKLELPECPNPPFFSLSCERDITLGENVTVISNHLDDGFGLKLTVFDGENALFSKTLTQSDSVFYANPAWAANYPNTSEFSLKIKVQPVFNGALQPVESEMTVFCSLASADSGPTAAVTTKVYYNDGIALSLGAPIVNRSEFEIGVKNVTCYQGATVESIIVRFDGFVNDIVNSVRSPIRSVGRKFWSVTLTDSRGCSRVYSGEITVYNYGPPEFDASAERYYDESSATEDIKFRITPTKEFTFDGANPYTYSYRFCNCADGIFSGWISTESRADIRAYADMEPNEVYEIQIRASDSAGLSTVKSYTVKCDRTDLHIGRNRLGIGKKATSQKTVDCAWDISCDGDIIFKSEGGNDVSLRSALSVAAAVDGLGLPMMRCAVRKVNTDEEISEIVNNIVEVVENCSFCTLALCVEAEELSLSKGVHFYIIYNDGINFGCTKI